MKTSKNIIVPLILIFIIGVPTSEVKAWGSNDHRACVEQVINSELTEVNFSNQELELLYKSVVLADDSDYRNPGGKYIGSLHGKGNYIAALKYVYELAFKYLENKSEVDDRIFINNYFNECNYLTESEKKNIANANTSLIKLVTTKILYTSSDYELSNRAKAIKILGFSCHLVGDIYAHDTFVPISSVSYTNYDPEFHFKQSNFTSDSNYNSSVKWSTYKLIISRFNIAFVDLNNLNTVAVNIENGSTVKLKALYEENLLSSISSDLKANLFEDNSKFHSGRFDATVVVTKEIIFKFNNSLILYENKGKIDSIFQKDILKCYYKDFNSTYTLQNFDSYYSIVN